VGSGKKIGIGVGVSVGVMIPKMVAKLSGQKAVSKNFNLKKYQKSRKTRFSDSRKFS